MKLGRGPWMICCTDCLLNGSAACKHGRLRSREVISNEREVCVDGSLWEIPINTSLAPFGILIKASLPTSGVTLIWDFLFWVFFLQLLLPVFWDRDSLADNKSTAMISLIWGLTDSVWHASKAGAGGEPDQKALFYKEDSCVMFLFNDHRLSV